MTDDNGDEGTGDADEDDVNGPPPPEDEAPSRDPMPD